MSKVCDFVYNLTTEGSIQYQNIERKGKVSQNVKLCFTRGSWLVVRDSWLVVRDSWLVVRGSWFVARGSSFSIGQWQHWNWQHLHIGNIP